MSSTCSGNTGQIAKKNSDHRVPWTHTAHSSMEDKHIKQYGHSRPAAGGWGKQPTFFCRTFCRQWWLQPCPGLCFHAFQPGCAALWHLERQCIYGSGVGITLLKSVRSWTAKPPACCLIKEPKTGFACCSACHLIGAAPGVWWP